MERGQGGWVRSENGPETDLLAPLPSVSLLQHMSQDDNQAKMMTENILASAEN